jgi:hypothetical protein
VFKEEVLITREDIVSIGDQDSSLADVMFCWKYTQASSESIVSTPYRIALLASRVQNASKKACLGKDIAPDHGLYLG